MDVGQPTSYAYLTEFNDTEATVVTLSDPDLEALTNAHEVILDETGHAKLLHLVENSTVKEDETIEQGDCTNPILHIVPNMQDEDTEGQEQALGHDEDDIVGVEHDNVEDNGTETAVVTLSDHNREAVVNVEEMIIDETGRNLSIATLLHLWENSTVNTILHTVPNMQYEDTEGQEQALGHDEHDIVGVQHDRVEDNGTETPVVPLSDVEEMIIDETGQVTLLKLWENSTVNTILHTVPNMQDGDTEDQEQALGQDEDDIDGIEHDHVDSEDDEVKENKGAIKKKKDARSKNKFSCSYCPNSYMAPGSLKVHMRACLRQQSKNPTEDRKCKVCKKIVNSVAYLEEHMIRCHTEEQRFRCKRCYRMFVDESKYNKHIDAHKRQDKMKTEAVELTAQHGKLVVVKEFTCFFCTQNYTAVFDVGQAKNRYACDTCRDKFSNADALRQHKKQFEQKREFSCHRCGRKYVFEGFLQRHLHTCDGNNKHRRDMK